MATDLTVKLQNEPGALAKMGDALGKAGVNIEGLAGIAEGPTAGVHILVEPAAAARDALTSAGIECGSEREVEVVSVVDQPGELGRHMRRVADSGVNVDLAYLATGTRLVLGSSDMDGLRRALHSS